VASGGVASEGAWGESLVGSDESDPEVVRGQTVSPSGTVRLSQRAVAGRYQTYRSLPLARQPPLLSDFWHRFLGVECVAVCQWQVRGIGDYHVPGGVLPVVCGVSTGEDAQAGMLQAGLRRDVDTVADDAKAAFIAATLNGDNGHDGKVVNDFPHRATQFRTPNWHGPPPEPTTPFEQLTQDQCQIIARLGPASAAAFSSAGLPSRSLDADQSRGSRPDIVRPAGEDAPRRSRDRTSAHGRRLHASSG